MPLAGSAQARAWDKVIELFVSLCLKDNRSYLQLLAAERGRAVQVVAAFVNYRHRLLKDEQKSALACITDPVWRTRWDRTYKACCDAMSLCCSLPPLLLLYTADRGG